MKIIYLVQYWVDEQYSSGGYKVSNDFPRLDQAIHDYMKHYDKKPQLYVCQDIKVNLNLESKIKAMLRKFKVPARIGIKSIEFN